MCDLAYLHVELDRLTGANLAGVLVVEDDPGFAARLMRVLETMRYEPITHVVSGEATLDLECPSVAIMDLRLPGMSGLKTIEAMRERCPGTKFIIMTSYGDLDTASRASQIGVQYFQKGADYYTNLTSLLDAIYNATHRRP